MNRPNVPKQRRPFFDSPGRMLSDAKKEWFEWLGFTMFAAVVLFGIAVLIAVIKVIADNFGYFLQLMGTVAPVVLVLAIVIGFTVWRFERKVKDPDDPPHFGGSEGDT